MCRKQLKADLFLIVKESIRTATSIVTRPAQKGVKHGDTPISKNYDLIFNADICFTLCTKGHARLPGGGGQHVGPVLLFIYIYI